MCIRDRDNGADYIMTQLCWDMEQFARWQDKIRKAGVTMPIDVGIMPILDQAATINMALSRNGCVMDRELSRLDVYKRQTVKYFCRMITKITLQRSLSMDIQIQTEITVTICSCLSRDHWQWHSI